MVRELSRKLGEMSYDGLITDTTPPTQVFAGTVRRADAEAVLPRGTILAKSSGEAGDGKHVILGTDAEDDEILTPNAILCDDLNVGPSEDVDVPVYFAGCFDPDKCTVKEGYTVTEDDRDKLRERGIVFKHAADAR